MVYPNGTYLSIGTECQPAVVLNHDGLLHTVAYPNNTTGVVFNNEINGTTDYSNFHHEQQCHRIQRRRCGWMGPVKINN